MRKKFLIIIIIFLTGFFINCGEALPCSEIFINNEFIVSARNFDFPFGDGVAVVTPRGIRQTPAFANNGAKPLSGVSKYGSVIFNVKLPVKNSIQTSANAGGFILAGVDGMNEYGFKAGSYFLAESEFPKTDERQTIASTQLLQYLLDNFKTVEEAVSSFKAEKYRVISVLTDVAEIKLRFYIHDTSGDSAIVEFIKGKLMVYRNPAVCVLTNTIYDESLRILKSYQDFGGKMYVPGGTESMDRFVRGAYYLKNLKSAKSSEESVAYGFDAIQLASVPPGFEHGCTQWTIVSDIVNKKMFFRTLSNPKISFIDLNKLDFSEGQPVRYLDFLQKDLSGDVSSNLTL